MHWGRRVLHQELDSSGLQHGTRMHFTQNWCQSGLLRVSSHSSIPGNEWPISNQSPFWRPSPLSTHTLLYPLHSQWANTPCSSYSRNMIILTVLALVFFIFSCSSNSSLAGPVVVPAVTYMSSICCKNKQTKTNTCFLNQLNKKKSQIPASKLFNFYSLSLHFFLFPPFYIFKGRILPIDNI